MTTTREAGIAAMKARAATQTTKTLCDALAMLRGKGTRRTPEESLTRSVLIDVLCERHPQAAAAADAWADDDSEAYNLNAHDSCVIGAARTAAGL